VSLSYRPERVMLEACLRHDALSRDPGATTSPRPELVEGRRKVLLATSWFDKRTTGNTASALVDNGRT